MRMDIFQDRLEAYSARAAELYPGEQTFTKSQIARIAGMSRRTLYNNPSRYCFRSKKISLKEFVRMELR